MTALAPTLQTFFTDRPMPHARPASRYHGPGAVGHE